MEEKNRLNDAKLEAVTGRDGDGRGPKYRVGDRSMSAQQERMQLLCGQIVDVF